MRHLLVLCLALSSLAVSAETYRWVDPQGRTVISDSPPPGRARDVSKSGGAANTDSLPYARGDKYGNWELSSDRANAARRVMEVQGLRTGQIRAVRGFADTDLRFRDAPLDARNRRVSILVRSQGATAIEASVREGQTPVPPAPPPAKERTVFDPPASAGR